MDPADLFDEISEIHSHADQGVLDQSDTAPKQQRRKLKNYSSDNTDLDESAEFGGAVARGGSSNRNQGVEDADFDSMLFPNSTSKQVTDDEEEEDDDGEGGEEETRGRSSKKRAREAIEDGEMTEMKKPKGPKNANDEDESDEDEENNDKDFDLSSTGDEDEDEDEERQADAGAMPGHADSSQAQDTCDLTKVGSDGQQTLPGQPGSSATGGKAGQDGNQPSTSKKEESAAAAKKANDDRELARRRKMEQQEEENKKMQVLMANFSEEQLNRYEIFRRSAFPKASIKKIIQTVCGKTVSASVVIAMSGIAKVFVGEIVEKSLDVKEKWKDTGALQTKHLREAYRLFRNANKLSTSVKLKTKSNVLY